MLLFCLFLLVQSAKEIDMVQVSNFDQVLRNLLGIFVVEINAAGSNSQTSRAALYVILP
jgi:hypothetical protein